MKTLENFISKSISVHEDKYDYSLSVYEKCDVKVKILCKKHNFIFEQEPRHHIRGTGCPKCSNKYKPTTDEFIEKSISINGDKYLYDKTVYKSNDECLIITCKNHGDFKQTPIHHINRKQGCPKCSKSHKNDTEEFIEKSKKIFGDMFLYDKAKYINWKTNVELFCKKHHKYFYVKPNSHLSKKQGCPYCHMSKGEFNIISILEKNNLFFIHQKKFKKCKSKKELPFDFYIPDLNVCIEYDGRHHFECVEKYGDEHFEKVIFNDKIKNDFCKKYNIKLLRIHYKYKSYLEIEKILKNNNII